MDSHTISALNRLEVVETGRRRRWSEEEKARIVLESMSEPRLVAATARRYGPSRSPRAGGAQHNPMDGGLFCFRGKRGDLLKVICHDGQGACLFTKRLERGRFIWPSVAGEAV